VNRKGFQFSRFGSICASGRLYVRRSRLVSCCSSMKYVSCVVRMDLVLTIAICRMPYRRKMSAPRRPSTKRPSVSSSCRVCSVCSLAHARPDHAPADVQTLLTIHVLAKIAFGAHDAAATLKLQQHGLAREDLALAVALDAPLQLAGALAARRAARRALALQLAAFASRMVLVALLVGLVTVFPALDVDRRVPRWFFACIVAVQVAQSFAG
jgi:hypothetical protein